MQRSSLDGLFLRKRSTYIQFKVIFRVMYIEISDVNSINNLLKGFSSLSFGVIIALQMAYIRVLAVVASIFFRDA